MDSSACVACKKGEDGQQLLLVVVLAILPWEATFAKKLKDAGSTKRLVFQQRTKTTLDYTRKLVYNLES